jgi:hypothetical protein
MLSFEELRQLEADLAHVNRVSMMGRWLPRWPTKSSSPSLPPSPVREVAFAGLHTSRPNLDRARAAAIRVEKDGTRAAEIIDRMRSFYKKSPAQRELVDVNGIIDEMLVLLRGEAIRYSIVMRTELAAELLKINSLFIGEIQYTVKQYS